jgi:hypothetical protein
MKSIGYEQDYFEGKILSADFNYQSTVDSNKCEEEKVDAYIPHDKFRKRDFSDFFITGTTFKSKILPK